MLRLLVQPEEGEAIPAGSGDLAGDRAERGVIAGPRIRSHRPGPSPPGFGPCISSRSGSPALAAAHPGSGSHCRRDGLIQPESQPGGASAFSEIRDPQLCPAGDRDGVLPDRLRKAASFAACMCQAIFRRRCWQFAIGCSDAEHLLVHCLQLGRAQSRQCPISGSLSRFLMIGADSFLRRVNVSS